MNTSFSAPKLLHILRCTPCDFHPVLGTHDMWPQTRQRGNQDSRWLGINLCEPHHCPCGKLVNARGTHGLSCKRGAARAIRHHQLNDIVCRALVRAKIPSVLEPSGQSRGDGKRPDGMTFIPWQGGKMSHGTSPSPTLSQTPTYKSQRRVQVARGWGGQQKGNQVSSSRSLVHLHPARFRNLRTNQRQGHQIHSRTRTPSQNHKR